VKGFSSRFSGMVFLGDVLRVGGRTSHVEEIGSGRLYVFEVYALRGEAKVASVTVEFLVYEG
jgi:acyl dehydratase